MLTYKAFINSIKKKITFDNLWHIINIYEKEKRIKNRPLRYTISHTCRLIKYIPQINWKRSMSEDVLNGWVPYLNMHTVTKWFWVQILWTWIVLLIKLKALALITLINYIINYVTSILLIIFWYYLFAPVANLWKQTHLER